MNLTLGAGDEENERPLLGGLGGDLSGGQSARGGAGFAALALPPVIVRLASIISAGGIGGGNSGSFCVAAAAHLPSGLRAGDAKPDDKLIVLADNGDTWADANVFSATRSIQACATLTTESGVTLTCSLSTPLTVRRPSGLEVIALKDGEGELVAVLDAAGFRWEEIVSIQVVAAREVVAIYCGDATYAAGDEPGRYIFTHNKIGGDEEDPDL